MWGVGFGVWGVGCVIGGVGFRVKCLVWNTVECGFRVQGWVEGSGLKMQVAGLRMPYCSITDQGQGCNLEFRVQGRWSRVKSPGFTVWVGCVR